jgi:hypothetical protein
MTADNLLLYHRQKLQEVGYRDIEVANSTGTTVNLTNAQTNQTISTVPASLVEITYSTNLAPNETREGYFILTATNATTPSLGTTKGYSIFYEGSPTNSSNVVTPEITTTSVAAPGNLILTPMPSAVAQVFDSFELIVPHKAVQTDQTDETDETNDDTNNNNNNDDDDENNNNNNNDDDDENENDCIVVGRSQSSASDNCDETADDNGNGNNNNNNDRSSGGNGANEGSNNNRAFSDIDG